MKYTIYSILFILSIIFLVGTVGALAFGTISEIQCILRGIIGTALAFFFRYMTDVEVKRENRRNGVDHGKKKEI